MSEQINVSAVEVGDKVKISLYGLPESDWLEVIEVGEVTLGVIMPSGASYYTMGHEWVTAYEPKDPKPEWWGALGVLVHDLDPHGVCTYDPEEDMYRDASGHWHDVTDRYWTLCEVTVVVDAEGRTATDRARNEIESLTGWGGDGATSQGWNSAISTALDVLDRERGAQ